MVLPGHLAGGYLTATALLQIFQPDLPVNQIYSLLAIGTLAGELPDIDLIFFYFKHRKDKPGIDVPEAHEDAESHRNYITHVPIFWIILSSSISAIGALFGSLFVVFIGLVMLCGTLSHLILDSIEYGIRWTAPWSKRRFALMPMPETSNGDRPGSIIQYVHFIIRTYWKTTTIWVEFVVTILALAVLFKSL